MTYLLLAIGLVLAVEGVLYALFPRALKVMIEQMANLPEDRLRFGGILALGAGVLVIWLSQNI